MPSYLPFLLIILVLLASLPVAHVTPLSVQSADSIHGTRFSPLQYGNASFPHEVMRPDRVTLDKWIQQYNSAQKAPFNTVVAAAGYPGSLSLLPYLQYTPSERSQGDAANCWVWAGTGVTEVALDVQRGIKDRLSIQYFDSSYAGGGCGWAGCGGSLTAFAQFYSSTQMAIPWSNTNAAYADSYECCHGAPQASSCPSSGCGGPSVPSSTISVFPYYGMTSITDQTITTQGVGQAAAIANIKNYLTQNKAVYFWFVLANQQDWNAFYDFWDNNPETAVWNPDQYSGHQLDAGAASHAVLVVGYDDTNPSNRYWIVLNSWGTGHYNNRPNGLFLMKMDINYDDLYYDPYWPFSKPSLFFQSLAVNFTPTPIVSTDKTTYAQGEVLHFSGTGFTPGGSVLSCLSTDNDGYLQCISQPDADSQGNVAGTMPVGTNILLGPQKFMARDVSAGIYSNAVQVTITSPVTVTVTNTVTSTVSSTSSITRYTTTTVTSYTSTTTSTSTIPTLTTVALVPLTVTSTAQGTQFLTSFLTTTLTSYTDTTTSTSTVPTTVVLVPLTVTSTAKSTQLLSSTITTTATSYTGTETSTSTIVVPTTVILVPSTVTSTVQNTQFLTSTRSTTVTSYTDTTTSTSTSVVYTTVTVNPTGASAGVSSNPLAYLGFLSLLAVTVGHRVTATNGWRIPRSRARRRCSKS